MLDLLQKQTTDIGELTKQFIDHCKANGLAQRTIDSRRSRLGQFAAFCDKYALTLNDLSNQVIDQFYLEYGEGRKKSTVNASRRVIKVFIVWIEGYKEIDVRANVKLIKFSREPKKLPKYLDRDVILDAIAIADPHDALMIETKWRAGLRISELVAIRERDINWDELHIHGKGANERTVYITDSLAKELAKAKVGIPDRLIFRNYSKHGNGEPISSKAARLHIQRVFKKIGITMTPHQLRHSFAVELLLKGCDIVSIQKMMGHEDITTTQAYLLLFDSQVKSQYKKFMV